MSHQEGWGQESMLLRHQNYFYHCYDQCDPDQVKCPKMDPPLLKHFCEEEV